MNEREYPHNLRMIIGELEQRDCEVEVTRIEEGAAFHTIIQKFAGI
jgi:hypothetical protein